MLPPVGMLFLGSATDTPPGLSPHFTFETILRAYGDRRIYTALVNSVLYAGATATLVLIIGGFLAWLVERTDSSVRRMTDLFTLTPLLMPAVLLVSGWILLLGPRTGIVNLIAMDLFGLQQAPLNIYSFWGMIWVGTLQELPLAFLWLWPAFRSMNPEFEEAAVIAGAGNLTVLRRITLPILRPAILGAWTIFFIYSLGALSVPLLIGLPAGIFVYASEIYLASAQMPTDHNLASAYSLLLVFVTVVGIYAYRRSVADAGRFATITGRGYRPRLVRIGRGWRSVITAFAVFTLLMIAGLPLLVLLWNSFMPYPQVPSWRSLELFTLRNYELAYGYGPAKRAVLNSLLLGLAAGLATTLLGALIAWTSVRIGAANRLVAWLDQFATIPIAIPGLIVGVSLLWLALMLPALLYGSHLILLLAYVILHLPYAVRICASGLSQIHHELEEAGYVSGAPWATVFRRITLLLLTPALVGSVIYVTLRSFREYAASLFLTAPGTEVFSVLVLDMWEAGNSSVLSAYVSVVVVLLALTLILLYRIGRRVGIRY
jgi:iron(III) transport system permease protein